MSEKSYFGFIQNDTLPEIDRLETEDEVNDRILQMEAIIDQENKKRSQIEDQERRMYDKLKRKYG